MWLSTCVMLFFFSFTSPGEPSLPCVRHEHNNHQPHGDKHLLPPIHNPPRWQVGQQSLFLNSNPSHSSPLLSVGNQPFFSCRLHSYPSWPIIHRCLFGVIEHDHLGVGDKRASREPEICDGGCSSCGEGARATMAGKGSRWMEMPTQKC